MPDISSKGSHEYWRQYHDPLIPRVLCWMESAETPRGKNKLFRLILQELGKTLDQVKKINLNHLTNQEIFIKLANQLNMSQALRLLQALDTAQPGLAAQLLIHAEQTTHQLNDEPGIFLQRNLVFERLRLLARIFSEERLNLVHLALRDEK